MVTSKTEMKPKTTFLGLLDAMYGVSAAIFSLIYSQQFVNGHANDHEEMQDLGGFFILIACGFGIISFCALFGLREYKDLESADLTKPEIEVSLPSEEQSLIRKKLF